MSEPAPSARGRAERALTPCCTSRVSVAARPGSHRPRFRADHPATPATCHHNRGMKRGCGHNSPQHPASSGSPAAHYLLAPSSGARVGGVYMYVAAPACHLPPPPARFAATATTPPAPRFAGLRLERGMQPPPNGHGAGFDALERPQSRQTPESGRGHGSQGVLVATTAFLSPREGLDGYMTVLGMYSRR